MLMSQLDCINLFTEHTLLATDDPTLLAQTVWINKLREIFEMWEFANTEMIALECPSELAEFCSETILAAEDSNWGMVFYMRGVENLDPDLLDIATGYVKESAVHTLNAAAILDGIQ